MFIFAYNAYMINGPTKNLCIETRDVFKLQSNTILRDFAGHIINILYPILIHYTVISTRRCKLYSTKIFRVKIKYNNNDCII